MDINIVRLIYSVVSGPTSQLFEDMLKLEREDQFLARQTDAIDDVLQDIPLLSKVCRLQPIRECAGLGEQMLDPG